MAMGLPAQTGFHLFTDCQPYHSDCSCRRTWRCSSFEDTRKDCQRAYRKRSSSCGVYQHCPVSHFHVEWWPEAVDPSEGRSNLQWNRREVQKLRDRINPLAQDAAASKLQRFFRSKQRTKETLAKFRLQDVSFPANAFANQNGDPLPVQDQWTILTRGVAIADPEEVQEVANAGRLVSTECCGALTLTSIKTNGPITSELITVQVTDAFNNKALIRVFLTQFGTKKVTKVPAKDIEMKLTPVRTLAFSVHRCLVEEHFLADDFEGTSESYFGLHVCGQWAENQPNFQSKVDEQRSFGW